MGKILTVIGADFSANSLKTAYNKSDLTSYIYQNNRLRLYVRLPAESSITIITPISGSAGANVNMFANEEACLAAYAPDAIQTVTGTNYQTGIITFVNDSEGYICVSLKRIDGSAISEEDKQVLIDSLTFEALIVG